MLLVETISTHFCWLTRRKRKLVQSKTLQQKLFVLISDFWQFRHYNFSRVMSNLKKNQALSKKLTWKLDNMKSPFMGSFFYRPKYKRWRALLHKVIAKQQAKRVQTFSLCFLNVFEFQENNFKIVQKNFWKIKVILIKK